MLLKSLSEELRKVFIKRNNITGSFIWKENSRNWTVYIGDIENVTGWPEYENIPHKKQAQELCDELNNIISSFQE